MNCSGQFVVVLVGFFWIVLDVILVVYDEFDMFFGVVKFKIGGGYGGYNGLCDIIVQFGNQNFFYCLWFGIGYLGYSSLVFGYVFGCVLCSEQELFDISIDFVFGVLLEMFVGDWIWVMQKLYSQKV